MSDTSNLCTRCKIENTQRDSYFCAGCEKYATVSRLVNLAPDDDGEAVVSMTGFQIYAARERIEGSSPATWQSNF